MIMNHRVSAYIRTPWRESEIRSSAPLNVRGYCHAVAHVELDHHSLAVFIPRATRSLLVVYPCFTMNMEEAYPALFENGQYLEEWDRERGDRYSEASRKAQEAVSRHLSLQRNVTYGLET